MRRKDFRLIDSLNERLNASLRSIESHEIFGDFIQAITFTSPSLPFGTCARVYVYEFANCAFTGCWLAKRNNKSGCLIYGASKMRNDKKKNHFVFGSKFSRQLNAPIELPKMKEVSMSKSIFIWLFDRLISLSFSHSKLSFIFVYFTVI